MVTARHHCVWCDVPLWSNRTREHLLPVAYGGTSEPNNLRFACSQCNSDRGTLYGLLINLKELQGIMHKGRWLKRLKSINETKAFWRELEMKKIGRTYVDLLDFETVINEMDSHSKE